MTNEIMLNIDELKQSVSNVRAKHSKEDIKMMAHSIKHRGIINPPAVAKNGDGKYEVIAGFLRTLGAKAAGVDKIRCLDVTALTPSERVEMSLSENVDRRNMTSIQYFHAFHQLFKSGMTVPTIAARFDKTEREVQQLLAIGSLPKKILDLAENEEIGDRALRTLAIASGKDVARYAKLKASERPNDWSIQEWLAGRDGMYMAKYALFDLDKYKGGRIIDLFAEEDEEWLTDGAQFMDLQDAALKQQLEDYKAKKWEVQEVEHWQPWAYNKTAKAKGGKVIWCRNSKTGEVQFHVGYARQDASGKAPKPKGKDGKPEAKPETSQAFDRYMSEIRHAAVQRHMLDNKQGGLVATLILLLKQCDNIQFRPLGAAMPDAYHDSLYSDSNKLVVLDDMRELFEELGIEGGCLWDMDIEKLGKKLTEYTPATLQRMIVTVVAHNWNSEGKDSDAIGKVIGLKTVNVWEPDDAFWDGIKNKATLIAIAKEIDVPIDEKATTKVIRGLLKEKRPDSWRPNWLSF